MNGTLGLLSLVDLLQMLVTEQSTGRLDVAHPRDDGSLWFRNGRIVHAEFDGHTGRNAVFALMADEKGSYEFVEDAEAPRESIKDAVEELLLDAIRRTDATRGRSREIRDTYIGDAVPTVMVDTGVADNLVLQAEELRFLRHVDGRRSVIEVAELADLSMMAVRRIISHLLYIGALKVAQRRPRTARLVTKIDKSGLALGTVGVDQAIISSWKSALGYPPREVACRGRDGKISVFPVVGMRKAGPFLLLSRETLLKVDLASDAAMLVKPVPRRTAKPAGTQA